jgi:hypothetical protein
MFRDIADAVKGAPRGEMIRGKTQAGESR